MSHLTHLVLSALQPASHTLYLNDPHRLSILSLDITASTAITQTSLVPPNQVPGDDVAAAAQAGAQQPPQGGAHWNETAASASNSGAGPSASAPPARTKDGIFDRAAAALNRAAARAGAAERNRGADALKDVAQGLHAPAGPQVAPASPGSQLALLPSTSQQSTADRASSSRPRSAGNPGIEQSVTVTLKPQSFTFGRDSRLTSPFIPLDIAVQSRAHGTDIDAGRVDGTSSASSSLAFISDPSPPLSAPNGGVNSGSSAGHGYQAGNASSQSFDPTRLLPLVTPPFWNARTRWKNFVDSTSSHPATSLSSDASALARRRAEAGEVSVVIERNEVRLSFRLRLAASAPAVPLLPTSVNGGSVDAEPPILSPTSSLALTPSAPAPGAGAGAGACASALAATGTPEVPVPSRAPTSAGAALKTVLRSHISADSLRSATLPQHTSPSSSVASPRSRAYGSSSNDSYGSASGGGLGEVIFICASSARPIFEALISPSSSSSGSKAAGDTALMSSSILRSDEAAALEGVQRTIVNARTLEAQRAPRGAREEVFEWTWKPRGRDDAAGSGTEGEKCCCAFVELDPFTGNPTLLSYFAFFIGTAIAPVAPLPILDAQYSSSSPSSWAAEFSRHASPRPPVVRSPSSHLSRYQPGTRGSSPPNFPQRSSSRPDTPSLIAALMATDGFSFVSSGASVEGVPTSLAGGKRNSIQVISGAGVKGLTASPPLSSAVRRRSAFVESSSHSLAADDPMRRSTTGLMVGNRLSPGHSPRMSAPPDAFSSPTARRPSRTSSLMADAVNTEPFPSGDDGLDASSGAKHGRAGSFRPSLDDARSTDEPAPDLEPADAGGAVLDLDRTELSLTSIQADTPILRAAIHNLERRTALVKKASKSAVKAAGEVRAALNALQNAQGTLDEALEGSAALSGGGGGLGSGGLLGSMPTTLGLLHADYLREARKRAAQTRKEEIDALFRYVEAPAQRTADLCRVALEKLKAFESESKSYYSGTQKWLASARSNGLSMSGTPGSEVHPSHFASESGNGHVAVDAELAAAVVKQERGEEKQKLRETRFHLARVELYKTMHEVHGGAEEVRLLKAFLEWSLWYEAAPGRLSGASASTSGSTASHTALQKFQQAVAQCSAKLDAEEAGINSEIDRLNIKSIGIENTLLSLGAEPSFIGQDVEVGHGADGSVVPPDTTEHVNPARQAGNRLKSLLSGLGKGNMHLNKDLPTPAMAPPPHPSMSSDTPVRALKRKISGRAGVKPSVSGINTSGITSPVLDAFHKIRGGVGGASVSASVSQSIMVATESPTSGDFLDTPLRAGAAVTASPSMASDFGPNSPTPDRRRNNSTSGAWKRLQLSASNALSDPRNSPKLGAHRVSPSIGRALSISRFPNAEAHAEVQQAETLRQASAAKPSAIVGAPVQPATASGDLRKKEGVLWVMSKPISGAAGPDAPRGVNRSTHWRECWVVLSGSGHIGEYADWKNAKSLEPSNPLIDLRFATVREARGVERRFTFEVVTRDSRRFFQAPDESVMREWMAAIAKAIESLLNGTSSVRQIDKVRSSATNGLGLTNEPISPIGEEFGGATARVFGLGQGKAFSQSLTDLSSIAVSNATKIFGRNGDTTASSATVVPNKLTRSSTKTGLSTVHLQAMSEGDPTALAAANMMYEQGEGLGFKTPMKKPVKGSAQVSGHSRGLSNKTPISNKTPVSGYVLSGEAAASTASIPEAVWAAGNARKGQGDPARRLATEDTGSDGADDFDRRIEQFIEDNYGSSQGEPEDFSYGPAPHSRRESQTERAAVHPPEPPAKDPKVSAHRVAASQSTAQFDLPTSRRARAIELDRLSRLPENNYCADCDTPYPRWASWALNNQPCCIFICISCSGFHRSLGVQTSKVKSVDLDDWTDIQLEAAMRWSNDLANAYWEAKKPTGVGPRPNDRSFWQAKYVERRWCPAEDLSTWYDRMTTVAPSRDQQPHQQRGGNTASQSLSRKASGTVTPSQSGVLSGRSASVISRAPAPAAPSILDEIGTHGPGLPGDRSVSPSNASLSSDDLGIEYDDG